MNHFKSALQISMSKASFLLLLNRTCCLMAVGEIVVSRQLVVLPDLDNSRSLASRLLFHTDSGL